MATLNKLKNIVGVYCYSTHGNGTSKARFIHIDEEGAACPTNVNCLITNAEGCNRVSCRIGINQVIPLTKPLEAALTLVFPPIEPYGNESFKRQREVAKFVKEWRRKNHDNNRGSS